MIGYRVTEDVLRRAHRREACAHDRLGGLPVRSHWRTCRERSNTTRHGGSLRLPMHCCLTSHCCAIEETDQCPYRVPIEIFKNNHTMQEIADDGNSQPCNECGILEKEERFRVESQTQEDPSLLHITYDLLDGKRHRAKDNIPEPRKL